VVTAEHAWECAAEERLFNGVAQHKRKSLDFCNQRRAWISALQAQNFTRDNITAINDLARRPETRQQSRFANRVRSIARLA
jgi:hypothetical protein